MVLRAVQDAAERQGIDRARVSARARDLALISRQRRALASLVADAGPQDGSARALLRVRRYGRHHLGRTRRARCRLDQRSDPQTTRRDRDRRGLPPGRARHVLESAPRDGAGDCKLNGLRCTAWLMLAALLAADPASAQTARSLNAP